MIYNSTSFFSVSEKSPLDGAHCILLKPFLPTCFQNYPISFLLKSSVAPPSRMSFFLLKLFHFKNSRIKKKKKKGTVCLTVNSPWLHPFLCHLSWWKSHLHLQPLISFLYSSVQFSSVAHSCPATLCGPMDCSTPSFPVQQQLPEFAQTHVHRVSDATQPSQPLFLSLLELGLYVHCAYKAE